jgi:chromosomal replication initiation ATPase DnaA
MFLDICPNCAFPVIYQNKECPDHRTVQSFSPFAHNTPVCKSKIKTLVRPTDLENLSKTVVAVTGVTLQDLCKGIIGNDATTEARQLFMYVAFSKLHYRQREIGGYLNQNASNVSMSVAKVRNKLSRDGRTRKLLAEIERQLLPPIV